jgi:regulator of sigma E protease
LDSHENQSREPHIKPDAIQPAANVPAPVPPPAPPAPEDDAPAVEMTFGQWLKANRVTLLIMVVVAVILFRYFGLEDLWSIAKAVIGLGLVIFIHELGHFLVAKWCDVHVVTFSIGFGPALPGCKFKWGETTYMLGLVPLGGYVQMVGQVDGDESDDPDIKEDPRSYKNKTVWQRMAIISAGVIMNVLLAFVCFMIVYTHGVERQAAVVSGVDTGSPAYRQGIPSGAAITEIGGTQKPTFEQLLYTVMNTGHGEKLQVGYQPYPLGQDRGDKSRAEKEPQPRTISIEPRLDSGDDRPTIGILGARSLQLTPKQFAPKKMANPVVANSPAAKADRPFEFGDRIVATTDPDQAGEYDMTKIKELPLDPRKQDNVQRDFFEFARRMRLLAGKKVVIRVERGTAGAVETVDIKVEPAYRATLGARMEIGQVSAVRQGTDAADQMKPRSTPTANDGDIIKAVEVKGTDGRTLRYVRTPAAPDPKADAGAAVELPLDPVRLPDQLREWAREMRKTGHKGLTVKLLVDRHQDAGLMFKEQTITLRWDEEWEDNNEVPLNPKSPLSIPGLGLAYGIKTTVLDVDPKVTTQLKKGDVIRNIKLHVTTDAGKTDEGDWPDDELGEEAWPNVFFFLHSYNIAKVTLKVKRDGETQEVTVEPVRVESWPYEERGLRLFEDRRTVKADNVIAAVGMGLNDTLSKTGQVYLVLRNIITGRISAQKTLGGPLTIGVVAFHIAGIDFWEFVFFLGLISINLAVVNFLPIPVLDGGHMVFLIYEKIRGKPASEKVRVGATYAGLLMLASLMIFVLFLDIKRFGGSFVKFFIQGGG